MRKFHKLTLQPPQLQNPDGTACTPQKITLRIVHQRTAHTPDRFFCTSSWLYSLPPSSAPNICSRLTFFRPNSCLPLYRANSSCTLQKHTIPLALSKPMRRCSYYKSVWRDGQCRGRKMKETGQRLLTARMATFLYTCTTPLSTGPI